VRAVEIGTGLGDRESLDHEEVAMIVLEHPSVARFPTVQMAVLPTAAVLAGWPAPALVLTDAEQDRARAFHDQADHDDFVAAHLLARRCVSRLTGVAEVTLVQTCAECGGTHGKPSAVGLPQVSVSWSHSRGHVAAVAAYDEVGIDVEAGRRPRDVTALVRRTASPTEAARILADRDPDRAYLHMWVAKEALVKVGAVSIGGFRHIDVHAGSYAGFDLTVTETDGVVVGLARQAPAGRQT
jgi:4'-phosphopantetheinyl transferase